MFLIFGNMKNRPKNRKSEYLNLLEMLLGNQRQSIINECNKKKIDLSDIEQVALYIKKKVKGQSK